MKTQSIVGLILIALGILAFVYQGVTYKTSETALDVGPLKVVTEKTKTIPLPPIVAAIAVVGGIVLLVVGKNKS